MTILSMGFIAFLVITLLVYYLVPSKVQWIVLLIASFIFYFATTTPYTFAYIIICVVTVYTATIKMEKQNECITKEETNNIIKKRKYIYLIALFICVGMLAALKYTNFLLGNLGLLTNTLGINYKIREVQWVASLGISFYTLQMVGYLTDVYWRISKAEKNIAKLTLFNCYFPQMISGPISRYNQISGELFQKHSFCWRSIYLGFLRILIGFCKKLVISEHLIQATTVIYSNPVDYGGIFIWIGTALYVIQIYADFSGCMDIVMGASECFGIYLPENFKTPFCSTTIQEFWQRWHITLGTWLKDYIMFPILRSKLWNQYSKKIKSFFGKKAAKTIPVFTGMLILWLGMGLWHGGGWNYIGEGLWFWCVIVLGQVTQKYFEKFCTLCRISIQGKMWYIFRCIRTTFIYAIGALFFRAKNLSVAIQMLQTAFSIAHIKSSSQKLFPIICTLDEQLGTTTLIWTVCSICIGIVIMVILGKMEKEGRTIRTWIIGRGYFVNGIIIYILLFIIFIFGAYGPGYSASEFIYGGF